MNWKHRALIDMMSFISEELWYAEWIDGNEYMLWQMAQNPDDNEYIEENLPPEDIQELIEVSRELKEISTEIGGWFMWDDEANFPRFVPMEEWEGIFSEWRHLMISLEAGKQ